MGTNHLRRWIIQDFNSGYRPWRIAKDRGLTVSDVVEVLVDNGHIHEQMAQCYEVTPNDPMP